MAEKNLNTRIALKYAPISDWNSSSLVLKAGELAIATVPTGDQSGASQHLPAVVMKVGDGTHTFSELPFSQAVAADVYGWAKAATKPSYSASEISDLEDFIAGEIQDTDTQYTIVKGDSAYEYKLMSKAKGAGSFTTEVATITIPNPTSDINQLKTLVGDTAVATQISQAIAALNLANTYEAKGVAQSLVTALQNGAVASNTSAINAIKDGESIDSFADVESALANKQAAGDYATKTDAQGYANTAKTDANSYTDTQVGAVQDAVDAVEALVGSTAVSTQISNAIGALDKNDEAVAGQVVSAVSQANGVITVARRALVAADIPSLAISKISGLQTELDGKQDTISFNTAYDASTNKAATMADITSAIGGLSGAMHFEGVKESLPSNTTGYASGDVIIVGNKEYVCDGSAWHELGDETIYAVKGSIVNADIAANAAIDQSKIAGLTTALAGKVNTGDIGTMAAKDADDYILKTEAAGYADILTKTSAASTYETKTDAASKLSSANSYTDTQIGGLTLSAVTANTGYIISSISQTNGKVAASTRALTAGDIPSLAISKITNLQSTLDAKANNSAISTIGKTGNINDVIQSSGDVLILNCGGAD